MGANEKQVRQRIAALTKQLESALAEVHGMGAPATPGEVSGVLETVEDLHRDLGRAMKRLEKTCVKAMLEAGKEERERIMRESK